jgi:high-affinity Fe2+/Pb2+ permease
MFIIWAMLIAFVPLMGLILYGWWHNRQVDKYEEWQKNNKQEAAPSA